MARRQGQRDVDDAVWVECLTLNILSTQYPIPRAHYLILINLTPRTSPVRGARP